MTQTTGDTDELLSSNGYDQLHWRMLEKSVGSSLSVLAETVEVEDLRRLFILRGGN